MTTSLVAEVPDKIIGKWVIHEKASLESLRQSPKYDKAMETFLPKIFSRLKKFSQEYTKTHSILNQGSKKIKYPIKLLSNKGGLIKIEGKIEGEKVILTFVPYKDEGFIIKSSQSDDMDYYVWKK